MATLADVIRKRRASGQSRTKSLMGSIKDKFKEKIDPRQFLNQTGVLTALFPSLKAFRAGGTKDDSQTGILKKSVELINSSISLSQNQLERISINTQLIAKNSMVLPGMSRDVNVMRQNVIKVVKAIGVESTNRADAFFKKSAEREKEYETKVGKTKPIEEQTTDEPDKKSFISSALSLLGKVVSPIISVFKTILSTVFSSIKFLFGTLLAPLLGIITKSMDKIVGVLTKNISKLIRKLVSFTNLLKSSGFLTSILGRFLISPPGLALLAGALLFYGISGSSKLAKQKNDFLNEYRALEFIEQKGGILTPDQMERKQYLLKILTEGEIAKAGNALVGPRNPTGTNLETPAALRAKAILDGLKSSSEKTRRIARTNLEMLGVSEEALQLYFDSRFGPNSTEISRREIPTLSAAAKKLGQIRRLPESEMRSLEEQVLQNNPYGFQAMLELNKQKRPASVMENLSNETRRLRSTLAAGGAPSTATKVESSNQTNESGLVPMVTVYDENFAQYFVPAEIGK